MTYYIIMHGTLGSGKSTCAKKLTKILNAERIDIDAVLRDNKLDHQASDSACIPAKNFIKGLDIVIPLAKDLLKKNKIAIFDGCLYHKEVLDYLIEQLKFPNYTFTLKTKLETCIKRDQNRERTIGEGVAREVYDLVKENDFGIIINTDDKTVDETLKEIRDCLPT